MKKTKFSFDKLPAPVKYLVYILGVYLIYKLYTRAKATGKDIARVASNAVVNTTLNQYGVTGVRIDFVTNVAEKIYSAFYKNDWFGWTEDEAKAIDAFNSLNNVSEAKACAYLYNQNYSHNLYADFDKFVTSPLLKNKIKSYLLNSIESV